MNQPTALDEGAIDIQEVLGLVRRQVLGMWRYRWIALAVAWVLSVASWVAVYLLPDQHEASAQVYVDTESVLRPLLQGLSIETDVMSDVTVMSKTLLTRPHLERVAREADLDLAATTQRGFETVVESLKRRIKIATTGPGIYTISYEDSQRETAINVVGLLLDAFVEDTLGSGHDDSQKAERTLKVELEDYERRLTEAEQRLTEFKRRNVGMMPDEHGDYYAQLQIASAELADVRQKTRIANEKVRSLARQLEGEEPVFGIMSSMGGFGGRVSSVDGQIASLEKRRSDLLVEYTEKHPEVVRVEQMLDELRAKREQDMASEPDELPVVTNPLDINPVYQSLKIQRSKVEVELASLRVEFADKQAKVDRLEKLVNVIPEVEAELNGLNRDYEVVKARYGQMLQRWEDLQTAKRVSTGTEEVQFRVINPPFASLEPAGPPRVLFLLVGFVGSLAAGIGVALLLNLAWPVFHESRDLVGFGYPVLGSTSFSRDSGMFVRRRVANLVLAGAALALVVLVVVVTVLASPGSRLLRELV